MTEDAPATPFLTVVRGDASPEELAALVAVLASRGGAAAEPAPAAPARWRSPLRTPLPVPGPGAWQASAW